MSASEFHTFHTFLNRYGSLKPAPDGRVPYLHTFHTCLLTGARPRVHARAYASFLGMEGMEVWKKQAGSGFAGSIPFPYLGEVWK